MQAASFRLAKNFELAHARWEFASKKSGLATGIREVLLGRELLAGGFPMGIREFSVRREFRADELPT